MLILLFMAETKNENTTIIVKPTKGKKRAFFEMRLKKTTMKG